MDTVIRGIDKLLRYNLVLDFFQSRGRSVILRSIMQSEYIAVKKKENLLCCFIQ